MPPRYRPRPSTRAPKTDDPTNQRTIPTGFFVERPSDTEPACRVGPRIARSRVASRVSPTNAPEDTVLADRADRQCATTRSACPAVRRAETEKAIHLPGSGALPDSGVAGDDAEFRCDCMKSGAPSRDVRESSAILKYQRCISSGSTRLCWPVRAMSGCADITPARPLRFDRIRHRPTHADIPVFQIWEQEAGSSNPTPTSGAGRGDVSPYSDSGGCIADVSDRRVADVDLSGVLRAAARSLRRRIGDTPLPSQC